ncbi:MAG TPA: hypothetical protein VLL50_07175, partial [Usitatibacter sp.]|nr:hypothetical protein [Usitatibacter sp.]
MLSPDIHSGMATSWHHIVPAPSFAEWRAALPKAALFQVPGSDAGLVRDGLNLHRLAQQLAGHR